MFEHVHQELELADRARGGRQLDAELVRIGVAAARVADRDERVDAGPGGGQAAPGCLSTRCAAPGPGSARVPAEPGRPTILEVHPRPAGRSLPGQHDVACAGHERKGRGDLRDRRRRTRSRSRPGGGLPASIALRLRGGEAGSSLGAPRAAGAGVRASAAGSVDPGRPAARKTPSAGSFVGRAGAACQRASAAPGEHRPGRPVERRRPPGRRGGASPADEDDVVPGSPGA